MSKKEDGLFVEIAYILAQPKHSILRNFVLMVIGMGFILTIYQEYKKEVQRKEYQIAKGLGRKYCYHINDNQEIKKVEGYILEDKFFSKDTVQKKIHPQKALKILEYLADSTYVKAWYEKRSVVIYAPTQFLHHAPALTPRKHKNNRKVIQDY